MNFGFIPAFRAHFDWREMMKNPSLRVLLHTCEEKYLHDFCVENNFQQQLTFSVRLPIKDHNHWQESPTELVVNDNVAQLVYPETEHTTGKENMCVP